MTPAALQGKRVGVIGTRTADENWVALRLRRIDLSKCASIVTGDAKGADAGARAYAREINIPPISFPADWNKHGNAAGPRRNRQIVEAIDVLIAFWDGKSPGTLDCIRQGVRRGIKVHIIPVPS